MPLIQSRILHFFFVFTYLIFVMGCSGSGSSTTGTTTDNALGVAYPRGMAVVSPLASQTTSASISPFHSLSKSMINLAESESAEEAMTFAEKEDAIDAILNATTLAGCFDYDVITLRDELPVSCYGPEIDLHGTHPDSPSTNLDSGTNPDPSDKLPTGDVGIWDESESDGEACLSAKINAEFYVIEGRVDFAMLTLASAICYANNSELSLPEAGGSLDMTSGYVTALNSAVTDAVFTPDSLILSRLTDTDEGDPVYQLSVSGESTENGGMPVTLTLKHIPTSTDNSTYKGLLQTTYFTDNLASGNCGGGENTMAASVLYEKSSSTDLRVRFKQAVFCDEAGAEDAFNDEGEIDGTNKFSTCGDESASSDPNGWGDDYTITLMNLDPTTGYGNFSYAWQAGHCDDYTRVFRASISSTGGSDSGPGGCGYFGFGEDAAVVDAAGDAGIDGLICNWAGPGGNKTVTDTVQRQCVTLDDTTGLFVSDSSQLNITYAPTNSCDNPGSLLECGTEDCPETNDLLEITSMTSITITEPESL